MIMLLEGAADAYVFPSLGTKKWDTCAPQAILEAAGTVIVFLRLYFLTCAQLLPTTVASVTSLSTGIIDMMVTVGDPFFL